MRRSSGSHRRARGALVVVEVALALVLLVASGLLFRSLERLFAVEAGFDPSRLLTMQMHAAPRGTGPAVVISPVFDEALQAVRHLPGVAAAALTSQLPLSGDNDLYGLQFEPRPADDPGELRGTFRYAVSSGYFETMGIPLIDGRAFNDNDREGAPLVAVVSESLAKRRLPGLDPLGQRVRIGSGPLYTIVGVVGDIRQVSLARSESEAVYVTAPQWRFAETTMSLVVRARDDAAALAPSVREAIRSTNKDQLVARVATMDTLMAALAADRHFTLVVVETFAAAALALAAIGLYGVLAATVTDRRREIGVRSALGASRGRILALVVRQGMTLGGIGVAIGLIGALAASRALVSLLFGISHLDPVTYVGVIVVLAGVGVLACAVPAWRAARIDPILTLKAE